MQTAKAARKHAAVASARWSVKSYYWLLITLNRYPRYFPTPSPRARVNSCLPKPGPAVPSARCMRTSASARDTACSASRSWTSGCAPTACITARLAAKPATTRFQTNPRLCADLCPPKAPSVSCAAVTWTAEGAHFSLPPVPYPLEASASRSIDL